MSANVVGFLDFPAFNLINADTSIFFISSGGLWQSGGEETGISLIFSPFNSEEFSEVELRIVEFQGIGGVAGGNGNLLFAASENEFGLEPWISDGTTEGTKILKDINTNGSSNIQNLIDVDGTFYFTAEDGVNQRTLWKSDGTPEGTVLAANINIGNNRTSYDDFTDFNGTLFFDAFLSGGSQQGLWKSDGTPEGTVLVKDFDSNAGLTEFTVVNNTLFFTRDGVNELWKTDGTTEGTQFVAEVLVAEELTSVGDTLFFVQRNTDIGEELWKSDGTPEGTVLVRDIRPEERSNGVAVNLASDPGNLIDVDGTLFFVADDGVNGRELWKSDGTPEGTQLVENIAEDANPDFPTGIQIEQATTVDGILYFQTGNELWQSDGTQVGTFAIEPEQLSVGEEQVVDSFRLRSGNTLDIELLEFNDQLYFTGEAFSVNEGSYQPALLTLEDVDNTIVYRLFNPNAGVHFYTTDASERDEFIATGNYQSEGESYRSVEPSTEGAEEVFRFFNETTGVHLYTTNEVERDVILDTLPDFTFQGARFSAYETEVEGSIPIYRFFEPSIGVHLYTPSEIERDAVQANLPNYNFEGIAYHALPLETEALYSL